MPGGQAATKMVVKPNCRTRRKRRKRSREGQIEMTALTAASHSPILRGVGAGLLPPAPAGCSGWKLVL